MKSVRSNKTITHVFAMILAIAMVITSLPTTMLVSAAEGDDTTATATNLALDATVSAPESSPWSTGAECKDDQYPTGDIADTLDGDGTKWHTYGTACENGVATVTYTWERPVTLSSSDVFFWTDGGGVFAPGSYYYEYLADDGTWKQVTGDPDYTVLRKRSDAEDAVAKLHGFNNSVFDAVTTTSFRIVMTKQDQYKDNVNAGLGIAEWKVYGVYDTSVSVADKALTEAIALVPAEGVTYTEASLKAYNDALEAAKAALADSAMSFDEKWAAAKALQEAYSGLVDADAPVNIAPQATVTGSLTTTDNGTDISVVNDGLCTSASLSSAGTEPKPFHFWGKNGQVVYLQYTWDKLMSIDSTGVFYFTDGGGVILPTESKVEYFDEDTQEWVEAATKTDNAYDVYNTMTFDTPIVTKQLKLSMTSATDLSVGVHEWQVFGEEYVEKLENVALKATAEASFCASWNKLEGVNDDSVEGGNAAYGSHRWGQSGDAATSASETITYTWDSAVTISSSDIYFWTDQTSKDASEGVIAPASYVYEYLAGDGTWKQVENATGYKTWDIRTEGGTAESLDGFNTTTFDKVTTTSFRVVMTKKANDANGVGVAEWKVNGKFDNSIAAAEKALQDAIALELKEDPSKYTADSYKAYTEALEAAKTALADKNMSGAEKNAAAKALVTAYNNLELAGVKVEEITNGYRLTNPYFIVETGKYGQITSLKINHDLYPTNYVMNESNAASQATAAGHQWMGELMFKVKSGDATTWSEQNTGRSDSGRKVELVDNKVVVTYENATEEKGIKDFKLVETYSLTDDGKLHWEMTVTNTKDTDLTIGDFGVPLAFNEYWPGGEEIYETRTVDHSFVGEDSSYIYVTRPSGLGQFLVMTPDTSTGAGFEYQDHWRTDERAADEQSWCQDQSGWANGLNVFYIHSDVIKSTNRGYLDNTSLTLAAGESKTYAFNFSVAQDEDNMKEILYNEGVIDAVAVPGMTYSIDMPGKLYLHTTVPADDINIDIQCPHDTKLHEGHDKTTVSYLDCKKTAENTYAKYVETKTIDGEQYHIYDIKFADLGQNNMVVSYAGGTKQTTLQFYMMDNAAAAMEVHSNFMVEKTQINTPGKTGDKVFDDWMMDSKTVRANTDPTYWEKNYWGWGDDWALTHGEYIAEKNVYQPIAKEIEAVDQYLDVAVWNDLMREHHTDYLVHDFLMNAPNSSPTYRGYAYPHIYNTYYSMYKIADKYPDMVDYIEDADTYLLRAYRIMKALYSDGVGYNWETGVMGELTTPDIIASLQKEGYYDEAQTIVDIMAKKYNNFKSTKYPYGSEYSYDNTGEEAVYTLAKVNRDSDTENAKTMMSKINAKTRACRGVQPIWYHYANPTTICGENWWNFQYTAALAGYCMDDWLRVQDNGMTEVERAEASRVNYAAKLANLTCINSGQIDADPENIGAVSWTYQSEMGNLGGQGTGGGTLHNGWRQMSGESDLGLFGALQILSSDVAVDPVFGLFGYGCEVTEADGKYTVKPLDGLFTRLNFINNELYIELERDQYTQAVVNTDNTGIALSMKNIEGTAHKTSVEVTGLAAGSYQVKVNNEVVGSFQAVAGEASTVSLPLPAAETAEVNIVKGEALANVAPVVDAGENQTVAISDAARLVAEATDDGYVNATLAYTWEVVSAPEGAEATIKTPDKHITDVSFSAVGEYTFKVTANDGELESSDTVTYTVTEDPAKPDVMADYTFDSISEDGKWVLTDAGKDYYGQLTYGPELADSKEGNGKALKMTGKIGGGYVELQHALVERVTNATIALDVYMTGDQANHTSIVELGSKFAVEFVSGNELALTVNGNTAKTSVSFAPEYWKNIAVTAAGDNYVLYLDGEKVAELENTGLTLKDIAEDERLFIGRSAAEADPFFKGLVDNFKMTSSAMTAEEVKAAYGSTEAATVIAAKEPVIVTTVGKAAVFPTQIAALYSNGVYRNYNVVWDAVDESKYNTAGEFTVGGKLENTDIVVTAKVMVVAGTLQNIAAEATPSAIINTPSDLGGVASLNDGNDPANSADTSKGAWHNWQGNQGAAAWIQYNWDQAQLIESMDIYFFKDSGGNFAPANYTIEYLDEAGNWHDVSNPTGLAVELNQYNKTTFDAVYTKAIRVTMNPASLGCGVLEWKVYGYKEGAPIDRTKLSAAITAAEALSDSLFTAGMDEIKAALAAAKVVADNKSATQAEIDAAALDLNLAMLSATANPEGNLAYAAGVSTTYVSSWEKLSAVNDGIVSEKSNTSGIPHYGTWGNNSAFEQVIYTWAVPVTIKSSDIYFWTDGGGILQPASYLYEYLDADGNWKAVENAEGYKVVQKWDPDSDEETMDGFNTTTFDAVQTTSFRVTINKPETDSNGIGLVEWRVFGAVDQATKDDLKATADLKKAISATLEHDAADYTAESYQAYAEALAEAKLLLEDPTATVEAKNAATEKLNAAYSALALKPASVDKTALKAAIAEAAAKVEKDYTAASWKAFAEAFAAAKAVDAKADATADEIAQAVTALKNAQNALVKSTTPTPNPETKPAKVTGVKAVTTGSTTIKISWKRIAGAKSYEVYRKNGSAWKLVGTTTGASLTVKKLKSNTSYQFYVRAKGQTLYGDNSAVVKSITGPKKVAKLKAKKLSKTSYKLTWKKSSKATGYIIYKKTGKGSYKKVKTLSAKKTSYVMKGLKSGKTYRFAVRAVRKVGKKTYNGTMAATKSVKIKK